MTVSTPTFDLIFNRVQRKEERLVRIARNKERADDKIEFLQSLPQSDRLDQRIAFIEGVQYAREFREAAVQGDIEFLNGMLPKDEITVKPRFYGDEITGEIDWLLMEVTVQDSPYDDSLFPTGRDKGLAYTTSGSGPREGGGTGSWHRTVGTSDIVPEDAVTIFLRGSHASAEQWAMGTFRFTVWDNFGTKEENFVDKTQLFQEQYDSTTYPVVIEGPTPIL